MYLTLLKVSWKSRYEGKMLTWTFFWKYGHSLTSNFRPDPSEWPTCSFQGEEKAAENFRDGQSFFKTFNNNNNNNNNNLFIYSALFNMLGDQKRITTINNLKTIQILKVYKYI